MTQICRCPPAKSARSRHELTVQVMSTSPTIFQFERPHKKTRIPKSIFHRKAKKAAESTVAKATRTKLTLVEEGVIFQSIEAFCDLGHSLPKSDISDTVQRFVENLSHERQKKIGFKDNRTCKQFVSLFLCRRTEKIKLGSPSKEEKIHFRSCNGETLTTHFTIPENVINKESITLGRLCNFDESGSTANLDALGRVKPKYIVRSCQRKINQVRMPTSKNVDRVKSFQLSLPIEKLQTHFLLFRIAQFLTREVINISKNKKEIETIYDCLPPWSIVAQRKKLAGIDTNIFTQSSTNFFKQIKPNT